MDRKLRETERKKLLLRHSKERQSKVRDRIKAVLAYDDGYSYSEIARILLLDDETIRRHVFDYFTKHKLVPENGGSKSALNIKQTAELVSHLKEETYLYVKDISTYVRKVFNVKYTNSGMTKWLRAKGFRYKKPHGVPAKADKEKQKDFLAQYKKLKETSGNKEPIYFVDSVHPEHQTRLAYGWIMKGDRKSIATTGRQYRLNIMGGICLNGHKIIYEQAEKVDEYSIQSFLYRLRKKHPGQYKVHIIWDNAGYHCSKKVQAFAQELGITLHYLPPYSPNLNPIERLWKIMHEQVTYNRYYEKFSDFTEAIQYFFRHIGKKKRLLRSRITDNFQVLDSPMFAS
jgi:transposase